MAVPPQSAQHHWVVGSNRPLFLKAEKTKLVPTAGDRRQSPLASIETFTCPTFRPRITRLESPPNHAQLDLYWVIA